MNGTQEGFRAYEYIIFAAAAILTAVICVCLGSVNVPLKSTAEIFRRAILGLDMPKELPASIILTVRLPLRSRARRFRFAARQCRAF